MHARRYFSDAFNTYRKLCYWGEARLLHFLHKLYNALGRSPNAAEQQAGMATLSASAEQGQPQLLQAGGNLAASLFNSAEYAARGRTDSQFVNWAYPQRQPDPNGHQAWLNAITVYGRAAVRDCFAYSPEFDSLVARVYGLSPNEEQRTELFIHKLYTSLACDPSAAELAARVGRINSAAVQGRAQTVAEARANGRELFLSQEYANRNRSNRDFVYDLYVALLDREPDPGGWDAWTKAVALYGRPAVLDGIAGSGEFDNRALTLYREVLWLVKDHLGTPRMVADRSGTLAGVRRHDYLPFGEEVGAGVGGRTISQGYSQSDGVRQKFTKKNGIMKSALITLENDITRELMVDSFPSIHGERARSSPIHNRLIATPMFSTIRSSISILTASTLRILGRVLPKRSVSFWLPSSPKSNMPATRRPKN